MRKLVIIMLGLAACGDSGVSIDSDADNVCGEIAEVACHNLYQCCSEGEIEDFLDVQEPRTETQCRGDVRRLCDRKIATRDFSVAEGRSTFDPQLMNTCLEALVAPDGVCATVVDVLPWAEACMNEAWVGRVSDGDTCFFAFECANLPDSRCAPNQQCVALPGNGQPCAGQCASNLFCGTNAMCQPTLAAGSPCTSSVQCQTQLFCDLQAAMPRCTARGDGGDPCTSSQGCKSFQCIPATCAGSTQTCFDDTDCSGRCDDDNGFCTTAGDCMVGHCSITMATSCFSATTCPVGETCVFPVACNPGDCVGQPACTANQITVDYCTGALDELPIP